MKFHIRLWLDRSWSGKPGKQVMIAVLIFGVALIVAYVIAILFSSNNLGQVFVDMVSPVTLRNKAYDSEGRIQQSFLCLTILYFLGSIFFSGVLIATITNIIRTRADKFRNGFVTYPFSNHVVVLGYNEQLVGLICRISDNHHDDVQIVLAVSHNVDKIYNQLRYQLPSDVFKRVLVLCADRCDRMQLQKRVKIDKACEVYIIGEEEDTSDTLNMNCFGIISSICDGKMPECVVNLRDQSTFALFQTYMGMKSSKEQHHGAETFDKNLSYLHTFNYCDEWARIMLMGHTSNSSNKACFLDYRSEEENLIKHPEKQVHIVIAGMTDMGEALARETAFLCHYPNFVTQNIRTKITFIDENARDSMRNFIGRYHNLFDYCQYQFRDILTNETTYNKPTQEKDFLDIEFEFIQSSMMNEQLRSEISSWAEDDNQILTLAICYLHSQNNITTGLSLPNEIYDRKIPVWIFQPAKGNIRQYLQNSKFDNVITFGEIEYDFPNLIDTKEIRLAKLLNHYYYHITDEAIDYSNLAQIEDEWRSTEIYNRWSCLFNVSAIPVKIRSCGGLDNLVAPENIRQNAIVEHNRWNVEKLLMGFRPTSSQEHQKIADIGNSEKKRLKKSFIHDDIRPFEQLPPSVASYDLAFVREIPHIEAAIQQYKNR